MHAIIMQPNGKYYLSAVFGYYRNVTAADDYQRYLEEIHNPYYIVWDSEKKRLIKQTEMASDKRNIIPLVLIVDANRDNWVLNEDEEGCVDFLNKDQIDRMFETEVQPEDILDKCRLTDKDYVFDETPEIRSEKDIENLMWVSGGFHDAHIAEEKLLEDGSLYIKFDGIWGCEIEVWFWGEPEYDTSSRNPEEYDPYWFGASVVMQDGFVYLIDEEEAAAEEITSGYCWFKARHMKYRIIPVCHLYLQCESDVG